MTPLPKNFTIASRPQWLRERFETFMIWYTTKYQQLVYLGFFYIGDLRSGQFRDLPIISQWGKTKIPQIRIRSVQIVENHAQLGYCWWPRCNFAYVTPGKVIWGQIMTSWGQCTFLLITSDYNEIETWGRFYNVPLVQTHQMICNMT